MKPKVIFIDWYKTLSTDKFWEQLQKDDSEKYQTINHALFSESNEHIRPWMKGKYSSEQIADIVAKKSQLGSEYVLASLIESAKTMRLVSPQIVPTIKKLQSKGIKVIIATDNMDTFTRWTVPALKLNYIFDGILNSFDLGYLKNEGSDLGKSMFFSNFFENTKVSPKETVLIDDSELSPFLAKSGMKYEKVLSPNDTEVLLGKYL